MMDTVSRIVAVLLKEFIQMRRDRLTFGVMIAVPIMQLILFGFAINSDPRHLPTYLNIQDHSSVTRSIVAGLKQSSYFDIKGDVASESEGDFLLQSGQAAFVITVPPNFTRALYRGERPQILIEADASDPSAASNALGALSPLLQSALKRDLTGEWQGLNQPPPPVDIVLHRNYNPEGISQYNIVPGLLGVILTMTMIMITSVAMTREAERGTLENLLSMPVRPWEMMVGKIVPYIGVGVVQTAIVLLMAHYVFAVPFVGNFALLSLGIALFIITNLAVGFTFSTIAKSQMQAMQLTFFFFLPSMLLSGFMFPFRGMPQWAQMIGEIFPLTHFLRIVRGVMLKGTDLAATWPHIWPLLIIMVVVYGLAMRRYRTTLD